MAKPRVIRLQAPILRVDEDGLFTLHGQTEKGGFYQIELGELSLGELRCTVRKATDDMARQMTQTLQNLDRVRTSVADSWRKVDAALTRKQPEGGGER